MAKSKKPAGLVTNRSERLAIRIHPDLLASVEAAAASQRITVSRWVTGLLEAAVAALKPKK